VRIGAGFLPSLGFNLRNCSMEVDETLYLYCALKIGDQIYFWFHSGQLFLPNVKLRSLLHHFKKVMSYDTQQIVYGTKY
jgi:hypothetical protein